MSISMHTEEAGRKEVNVLVLKWDQPTISLLDLCSRKNSGRRDMWTAGIAREK